MQNSDKINITITWAQFKELLMQTDETNQPLYSILSDKLQRLVNHDLYSKFKCADSPEEREQARKQYLESKGIPEAFRW